MLVERTLAVEVVCLEELVLVLVLFVVDDNFEVVEDVDDFEDEVWVLCSVVEVLLVKLEADEVFRGLVDVVVLAFVLEADVVVDLVVADVLLIVVVLVVEVVLAKHPRSENR